MKFTGDENHPTLFELKPDRNLIDPKFEGYKLSLETLPTTVIPLEHGVDHANYTDEQYSLQHVKLAALNNHIFPDYWNPGSVYIVDQTWTVLKFSVIPQENRKIRDILKLWTIPESEFKKAGRFNISITFPDSAHAILADGCGGIYILETGQRNLESQEEWKIIFHQQLFLEKKNPQFIVLNSIQYNDGDASYFDVLLLNIDERANWKDFLEFHQDTYLSSSVHPFVSVLEWLTFSRDGDSAFKIESSRTLVGRSGVEYTAIEPMGIAIYIASDDPYYFSYDSKNPIAFATAPLVNKNVETCNENEQKTSDYVWYQTEGEVNVWFRLPEDSKKSDLQIDISVNDIHVEYKKQIMLSGKYSGTVKNDESTWTLESGKLEIMLTKAENGRWDKFVPDNDKGEQIQDPELVEQIHSQLAHMCHEKWGADPHKAGVYDPQQLEECDEYPAATAAFMRIDRKLQRITNKASLDCHQWLFSTTQNPGTLPSFCIRHDVDGLVWQPQLPVVKKEDGSGDHNISYDCDCKHIATFCALGYVQAAKEKKKFTLSAPDFSYAVIINSIKHIHLYRQPAPIESDLRNRKTGAQVSHVARQQIITVEPPLEVMGAYAGNEYLFALTSKNLHLFKVNEVPEQF